MKQPSFLLILAGIMLLSNVSFGQYKYTYKKEQVSGNKATYQFTPEKNDYNSQNAASHAYQSQQLTQKERMRQRVALASNVTDPPIINDPIDVYEDNPALLKATLYVHFGDLNKQSGSFLSIDFMGNPYYDYHKADHIGITQVDYTNDSQCNPCVNSLWPNGINAIPLYVRADNHRTVTYQDFVSKWADAAHTHMDNAYWATLKGGSIELQGLCKNIHKVILVLQFDSGTKTIVWNTPQALNHTKDQTYYFNQDFMPTN